MSNRRQIYLCMACVIATSTASHDAVALSFGPPYFYGPSYPISGPYETIEDAFDHWIENFVAPQSRESCRPVIERHNNDYRMYMDGDGCNYLDEDAVQTYRSPLRDLESENTCLNIVGNPVNSASGVKIETYIDYETVDGLVLSRHYTSAASSARGSFGKGWRSSFDRRLVHTLDEGGEVVTIFRHDASVLRFRREGEKWVGARSSDVLTRLRDEKGDMSGWSLRRGNGEEREEFGTDGRLLRLSDEGGVLVSLEYGRVDGARDRLISASDKKGRAIRFAHEPSGRTTSVTLPGGSVIHYEYGSGVESLDEPDHLEAVVYPDGSRMSYGYGEIGKSSGGDGVPRAVLVEKVDEAGNVSTFEYDHVGRAISSWRGDRKSVHEFRYAGDGAVAVTYPSGGSVNLEVVRNGNAKRISKVSGACGPECGHRFRSYNWNGSGFLGAATSWDGMSVQFDHDVQGRVTRSEKSSSDGSDNREVVATTWHPQFYLPVDRSEWFGDSLVSSQKWSYNSRGQILTEVSHGLDTGGDRVVSYEYCEQQGVDDGKCPRVGLLLGVRGAREDLVDTYRYEYFMADDPGCGSHASSCQHRKGDLRLAIDPVGREIRYLAYDAAGRLSSALGTNGEVYAYRFDGRGRPVERAVTPRGGGVEDARLWRVQYFENGSVRSVVDADGVKLSYSYDDADFLVGSVDSAGSSASYERNDAGLVERTTFQDADGRVKLVETSRYNARGELESGNGARDREVALTYSDSGNVVSARYEGRREDRLSYDTWGRPSILTEDVNGVMRESRFHHGANNRVVGVTDPKGLVTGYLHDARGDLIGMDSPDLGAVTLTRDPAGNVVRRIDGRGAIVDFRHDAVKRVVSVKGGSGEGISFVYDAKHRDCRKDESHSVGELTSAKADVGSVWCIDPIRNAVREIRWVEGHFQIDHSYEYTKAGRLRLVTYPDGNSVEYHRDAAGRVSSVDLISSSGKRVKLVEDVVHRPFGPMSAWSMVGGRRTEIGYDDRYRPISVSSTGDHPAMNIEFRYTPSAQIGEVRESEGRFVRALEHKGLDWVSGSSIDNVAVDRYEYDVTGNRLALQRDGKVSQYVYPESSHRLMSVGGEMRQYDDAGNLQNSGDGRALAYDSLGRLSRVDRTGGASAQYGYDGLGRRAWRTIDGKRVHWLYGQDWKWLGEYDDAGRAMVQVIWLDDRPVALMVGDDAKIFHVQTDHLGTPRAVVDPDRNVVVWEWKLSGEMFGNSKPDEDPDGDGASFTFDMRFPGQRWDGASGYHYNYHRDYDPATGRYVQSDPIGLDGGMGTYLYAENNPLQLTDRWGFDVDIFIWNRIPYERGIPSAGKLHSTFGHVSVDANGFSYSFNQSGMLKRFDYSDRQTKWRGGDVFRLRLDRDEEVQLAECLDGDHGSYQAFSNNCGHPVQNCLRKIGKQLLPFNRNLPSELKYDLIFSPLSKSHKSFPQNKGWIDLSKP